VFVGIDVSKGNLDVASDPPGALDLCGKHNYSEQQVQLLVECLKGLGPSLALVVVEDTGRLEALIAYSLQEASLLVAVRNDIVEHIGELQKRLSATKRNAVVSALYERLLKAGKAKKVALTARMHKMLTMLNTMVRKDQTWSQWPQTAQAT
jgi:transposase